MSFDGYIRVSKVNGRGGASYRSPGDQRAIIEGIARDKGLTLGEVVEEQDVSGGKTIAERELGRLVQKIRDGESEGVIVWNVKRYSRDEVDGLRTALDVREAGGRIIAENIDTADPHALPMLTLLLGEAERELDERRATWARAAIGSLDRGVHAGAIAKPPLGYVWPLETVNGKTRKAGPLVAVEAEAARVLAGFKAFDEGASWREVVGILGVASQGAARNVLTNRVYLGEARAHGEAREGAHEAIVDADLFARVGRKLAARALGDTPRGRKPKTKLAGVLRCGTCGGSMGHEAQSGAYRCRAITCTGRVSVKASEAEAYLIEVAREHHRQSHEAVATALKVDDALVPELERAVIEAEADRLAIEAAEDELDALDFARAMTKARKTLDAARRALDNAEAGQGWHGMTPERVEAKLADADGPTVNGFVRAMLKATVAPSGRSRHLPVADRMTVTTLVAGKVATERHPEAPLRELARVSG